MLSFIRSYPFALDIALGVVLLVSCIIGAKRGLIKSLMGIAILGVALVGASWCSGHLTEPVTEWIQPKVTQYVVKKATTKETAAVPQAARSSVDLKSMDLSGIDLDNIDLNEVDLEGVDLGGIDLDGLDLNDLYKKFGGLFDGENGPSLSETLQNVQSSGQDLVTGMVTQLLTRIVHVALFVVAFLVLWLVLWLVTRPLELATKLPVLHGLDAVGGGILGLLSGAVLAFIALWVVRKAGWLDSATLESTYALRYFTAGGLMDLLTNIH